MKNRMGLVILLILSLFLCGCKQKDYTVHFKEELVIDYNSNDSPLTLIESIGNTKITEDMIKDNAIIVDNFKISCEPIDTNVEQNYIVIYKTNDTEISQIKKQVYVKDINAPEITFKSDTIIINEDQMEKLNLHDFITVKDNFDKAPHIEVTSDKTINSPGKYTITVIAEDVNKNKSQKLLTLIVKENNINKGNNENQSESKKNKTSNSNKKNSSNNNSQSSQSSNENTQNNSEKSKSASKKYVSKKFLFGEFYEYNGKKVECNIDNVSGISQKYLLDSGKSGECVPIMKDGIYIGMQVNIYR